jgi:RimJ/RimL family protein N-acetyltransferase
MMPTDYEDLEETFFSFFPEAEADPGFGLSLHRQKPTMEEEREWFSGLLKDVEAGNVVMTVAEVDSHAVGNCIVRRVRPGSPLDHRGSLGISIRKQYRGKGIGTALLRETIERCRGKFEILELTVFATNPGARALYKRFGFTDYGHMPRAIKRAGIYIDEWFMYLKL